LSTENFFRFRRLGDIIAPQRIPRSEAVHEQDLGHSRSRRGVIRRVACNMKAERLYLQRISGIPAMLLVMPLQMCDDWRAPRKLPTSTPAEAVVEEL
jgi:hypothetical protein